MTLAPGSPAEGEMSSREPRKRQLVDEQPEGLDPQEQIHRACGATAWPWWRAGARYSPPSAARRSCEGHPSSILIGPRRRACSRQKLQDITNPAMTTIEAGNRGRHDTGTTEAPRQNPRLLANNRAFEKARARVHAASGTAAASRRRWSDDDAFLRNEKATTRTGRCRTRCRTWPRRGGWCRNIPRR